MRLNLRLGEYLQTHNLTAYKLEKAVSGVVSRNTVYKWARETEAPEHIHTAQFVALMQALTRLTGQPVTPNDLLEVIEEPIEPDPIDVWLTASVTDLKAMLEDVERDENPLDVAKWSNAFTQDAQ